MNSNPFFSTAIHEAAHGVAADLHGVSAYAEITPGGFSQLTKQTLENTGGICWLSHEAKPFPDAVISWAGILGEAMLATPPEWAPPFRPTVKLLRDWHGMVMQQIHRLSESDRIGIVRCKDTWRACRSAFTLICRNRERIKRLATVIAKAKANDHRKIEQMQDALFKLAHGPKEFSMPVASIIAAIKNHLSNLAPDDLKRPALERAIDCYQRDGKLPADLIAELEKK